MGKKILITGGAGFIGTHLSKKLSDHGWQVTVLDNLSPQIHGKFPNESDIKARLGTKVKLIRGDVRNYADWEKALKGQESVIHLAAETGTGQSMYKVAHYTDVNITGTAILLDILIKGRHRIEKLLLASSRAIYGEGKNKCKVHNIVYPESRNNSNLSRGDFSTKCPFCNANVTPLPTDEDSRANPVSIYAVTKLAQEEMVQSVCRGLNIPVTTLRYQNVYGPGQSLKNPYTGILSIFSTAILRSNPINIFEDGLESRDFIYIADACEATISALENNAVNNHIINVGTGVPITVLQVAKSLKTAYNSSIDIKVTGNYRIGDIRHSFASVDRMEKLLGFRTSWSFDKGLDAFAKWVHTQKISQSNYVHSLEEMRRLGFLSSSSGAS